MHNIKNLSGRFGRLTIVARDGSSNDGQAMWRVICDCGNTARVRGASLRSGATQSCGCYKLQRISETKWKHGSTESKEYRIWSGILTRCKNKNRRFYKNYGGRGIMVCDRWANDFSAFLSDMGPMPSDAHTLDRINNDGDYDPDNCRWATRTEQNNNRRDNRIVIYSGSQMSLADAIRKAGSIVERYTVHKRLKLGWDLERAITTPARTFTWADHKKTAQS